MQITGDAPALLQPCDGTAARQFGSDLENHENR